MNVARQGDFGGVHVAVSIKINQAEVAIQSGRGSGYDAKIKGVIAAYGDNFLTRSY